MLYSQNFSLSLKILWDISVFYLISPQFYQSTTGSKNYYSESWVNTFNGVILGLFVKSEVGMPMVIPDERKISLLSDYGIENDRNANSFSPRQVLLTNHDDLEEFNIRPGELRENITLANVDAKSFVPGALVQIGSSVKIRLTFYCEPCKRVGHLVKSHREIEKKRGILGVVLSGGTIHFDDKVLLQPTAYKPLSEIPFERFVLFVSQIPEGKVVTYKQITVGMGVADSYIRAMPGYIKKAVMYANSLPIHRIVTSSGDLINSYVIGQMDKLRNENVEVIEDTDLFSISRQYVDISKFSWLHGKIVLP